VGRALEVIVQSLGYHSRFLYEVLAGELRELLADYHLLLVAPPLSEEHRRFLLDEMLSTATPVKIAVLELLPANGGEQLIERENALFWPCSKEQLKRAIDATLLLQS